MANLSEGSSQVTSEDEGSPIPHGEVQNQTMASASLPDPMGDTTSESSRPKQKRKLNVHNWLPNFEGIEGFGALSLCLPLQIRGVESVVAVLWAMLQPANGNRRCVLCDDRAGLPARLEDGTWTLHCPSCHALCLESIAEANRLCVLCHARAGLPARLADGTWTRHCPSCHSLCLEGPKAEGPQSTSSPAAPNSLGS